jgi:hypothetical protein
VDIDGDGKTDILSGSYSRHDKDMAGLFQLLRGKDGGGFRKAAQLCGSDGEPLILPAGDGGKKITDKICTRPFACDLDGDQKLDIVSGNFGGTFGFFKGEGGGTFAPQATWLQAGGKDMSVPAHSDPFLIDWSTSTSPSLLRTNTAIGTPQARWREMTQSGFASIMPVMRFSPDFGTHSVSRIDCSETSRSVAGIAWL